MSQFSNDHTNLTARLMGLYPLEIIKQEYTQTGRSDTVYAAIAKNNTLRDLEEDAIRMFGYTRQHCYFFPHSEKDLTKHHTDFFAKELVHTKNIHKQEKSLLVVEYLLNLHYNFLELNNRTNDERKLKYFWPVKIIFWEKIMEVRLVIMERFMKSTESSVYRGRDFEEEDVVRLAIAGSATTDLRQPLDLNKGIKSLWHDQIIDAIEVAHKSSSSVDRATMDHGLTFRATYPDRYAKMIKDPLRKMSFYNWKEKSWPYAFAIDASTGFLAFPRFQSSVESVDLLVNELLNRNA
jgi:hypothetical protein